MKKCKIMAAAVLVLTLCGCSKNNSESNGSSAPTSAAVSNAAVSSAAPNIESGGTSAAAVSLPSSKKTDFSVTYIDTEKSEVPTITIGGAFIYGPARDEIAPSDIKTVITRDGSECSPEDLTEDNFSAVLCEGFTYVAPPSKISRNSVDNADVFDTDNFVFTDTDGSALKNFVRLNVGDTICGLTLTKGETNFARGFEDMDYVLRDGSVKKGSQLGILEIYFTYGSAEFEGELTMTGYIMKVAEDQYGVQAGAILFVPDDGEAGFPVMSYQLSGDDGIFHAPQIYNDNDLTWENEFGYLRLGNASSTTADISALPDDGSFVKARITAESFKLNCGISMVNSVTAVLKDVEIIDNV